MGEKMTHSSLTAEHLARRIRVQLAEFNNDDLSVEGLVRALVEVRRSHLTQPAQAVDVGAIRDVIADMCNQTEVWDTDVQRWADKLTAALPKDSTDTETTQIDLHAPENLRAPDYVQEALAHFEVSGDELDQHHAQLLATDAARWARFRQEAVKGINHQDFSFPDAFNKALGDPVSITETQVDEAFDEACKETQG